MFLQITPMAVSESSSQLTRKPVPVPTGAFSRVRWDFVRAYAPATSSLSILQQSQALGWVPPSVLEHLWRRWWGPPCGEPKRHEEGERSSCRGEGEDAMLTTGLLSNLSCQQLVLGKKHLSPALLPGQRSGEVAVAAKCQVGSICRTGCPSCMICYQCREP